MSNLVDDVMALIFELSPTRSDMVALSQVSRQWRHVALSHSRLWREIVIEIDTEVDANMWVAYLPLYLSRSGSHPLRIFFLSLDTKEYGHDFSEQVTLIVGGLVGHANRWETLEIDLGTGIKDDISEYFDVAASQVTILTKVKSTNWLVPLLDAPNLTSVTIIDAWMKPRDYRVNTSITNLVISHDTGDINPIIYVLKTSSHSLINLSLSVYGWDDDAHISVYFPNLLSLTLEGPCTLLPHLLEHFRAPSLKKLDFGLWRSEDIAALLSCPGIPFEGLEHIIIGWTVADELIEIHQHICNLINSAVSMKRFEIASTASPQCLRTVTVALYTCLSNPNGGSFALSGHNLFSDLPRGLKRLFIQDNTNWGFPHPLTAEARNLYLREIQLMEG